MLKPVENFVGSTVRVLDNLDDTKLVDSWHAMNTWVTDGIPMAGATWRQLIVDFYRENRLMRGVEFGAAGLVLLFGVGLLLGYIAAERVTCF